ncbi:MAG: endonuclease/exonuclease/phosphatase family protein [Chloroflexi bacterium]|nr:endonuclease/exonuclease/phosphatase family protein [Chloroflexota bacterium]
MPSVTLLALLLAARIGTWSRAWQLDLLDTFALLAFAPFVGVALAAAMLRSRTLAILAAASLAFFAQQFGGQVLGALLGPLPMPPAPSVQGDRTRVRILTYNIRSPNSDPEPLLAVIRAARPDVIAIQELTRGYADRLTAAIDADYPFVATAGLGEAHAASGTWSRLPILDREAFQPSPETNIMHRVRLSTGRQDFWLYNVHLASPWLERERLSGRIAVPSSFETWMRDDDLAWLIRLTRDADRPYVLAGDFNTAAGSRPYRSFPPDWRDAFGETGRGFGDTFPTRVRLFRDRLTFDVSLVRIDYVLASTEIEPHGAWIERIQGSDHEPVIADVALPSR